jgi:hypothetical protein
MAACGAACGIACPAYAQKIDGYCYAVMDKTPKATQPNETACPSYPNCTQDCQIDFIQMPIGWQMAPCATAEVARSMYSGGPVPNGTIPATYAWGCDYLVYNNSATGKQCNSATWNGGHCVDGCIDQEGFHTQGSSYKVKSCHWGGQKVVMRIPAISASVQYF